MNFSAKNIVPVSIIVPSLATLNEITPLITSLYNSSVWARQVIIVDVGNNLQDLSNLSSSLSHQFLDTLTILPTKTHLYPGEARNKAVSFINCELIAFLDVNTLPDPFWLEAAHSLICESGSDIIFGLTKYVTDRIFQQSLIDSTYGRDPVITLPGSMMTTTCFGRVGHFLPKIRSGEDTDWLIRCSQFFKGPYLDSAPLTYHSVPRTYLELYLKWYRNYSSCAAICFHLQYQRFVYVLSVSAASIFLAYNWNSVIASWSFANPFYVHNITKMVSLILLFLYCLIRGFYMPLTRGVPFKCLLPFRFLRLAVVCLVIDTSKAFAFLLSRPPLSPFSVRQNFASKLITFFRNQ